MGNMDQAFFDRILLSTRSPRLKLSAVNATCSGIFVLEKKWKSLEMETITDEVAITSLGTDVIFLLWYFRCYTEIILLNKQRAHAVVIEK